MKSLEGLGKVLTTDVLVIGGGIGGIPAAIKARDNNVDVLIVDKAYVGFGGMAPRGGNGILALPSKGGIDEYVAFITKDIGLYLNDQKLLRKYAEMIYPTLEALHSWGVELSTEKDGTLAYFPFIGSPLYNTGINLYATDNMRKTAVKKGVKIQNQVNVTSLIKSGGRVVGAVGFDIVDGTFYIFRAKTVIVACGACEFKTTRMFTNNGEGTKLAWDAGAQMRNAEFAFVEIASEETAETIHGGHTFVFNQKGENIWKKYVKWNASDVCADMILGMEKEMREGNGPLFIDLDVMHNDEGWKAETVGLFSDTGGPKKLFPDKLSWVKRQIEREHKYFTQGSKPVVTFTIHGNLGCVRVDGDMKTTVDGLYVVGWDNANGSAIHGAFPQPAGQRGGGFMHSAATGIIGGVSAANEAKSLGSLAEIPTDLISELKEKAYANLNQEKGINPREVLDRIQKAVCPIDVFLRRSEASLNKAIGLLDQIKADLPKMAAADYHELKLCSEMNAMALTSELMVKSALARKETRSFHYREDYPKTDNKNWLKWVVANNVNGEVVTSTEDIPIKEYQYQPPNI
ncbi:MAG: FAD-binding protein [Clostridiales bacterium]|nr:FAD-binding protein [Clostridiales bacterium]